MNLDEVKIGMKVKVKSAFVSTGTGTLWDERMDETVGNVYDVDDIANDGDIRLLVPSASKKTLDRRHSGPGWWYPASALESV